MPRLSKSDRLAHSIGLVTLKYNDVQFWFYLIFQTMLHDALYLAHPTFFSVKSDRGQRDMVRNLATERLKEYPIFLKALCGFIERANKLGGRRNEVLHAMWNYEDREQTPNVRLPFHNRLIGQDADKALSALLAELQALETELWPFYANVRDTLRRAAASSTRRLVAEAFAKGLQPPPQDREGKPASRQNGRKGSPRQPSSRRR
jgi:hypothetical protein